MKRFFKLLTLVLCFGLVATLASCAPKDASAARSKLEKKDYSVSVLQGSFTKAALTVVGVDDAEAIVTATKTVTDKDGSKAVETVTAVLFESSKDANKAFKNFQDEYGKDNEVKKSGKWIYYGTEKGIKDFA